MKSLKKEKGIMVWRRLGHLSIVNDAVRLWENLRNNVFPWRVVVMEAVWIDQITERMWNAPQAAQTPDTWHIL